MTEPSESPRPSGNSCWKWGGISCVGCGCLVVVIVAVVVSVFMSRPTGKRFARSIQDASEAVVRMQEIGTAIGKYAHDRGVYPDKLTDLAPTYIEESKLRVSSAPDAPLFEYHKPPPDAPDSFAIVTYEMKNPIAPDRAPSVQYYLTKAGKIGSAGSMPPPTEEPSRRAPHAPKAPLGKTPPAAHKGMSL